MKSLRTSIPPASLPPSQRTRSSCSRPCPSSPEFFHRRVACAPDSPRRGHYAVSERGLPPPLGAPPRPSLTRGKIGGRTSFLSPRSRFSVEQPPVKADDDIASSCQGSSANRHRPMFSPPCAKPPVLAMAPAPRTGERKTTTLTTRAHPSASQRPLISLLGSPIGGPCPSTWTRALPLSHLPHVGD